MKLERLRQRALAISDLRDMAKKNLPRGIFEYVARGTDDDLALRANSAAFDELTFQPRVARDVSAVSTACSYFGHGSSMPLAVAPTGFASLMWRDGELASARAAAAAGIPFALSTGSITPMEKIREVSDGQLWLQLYVWPQREMTHELVRRAKAARFDGLIVTVDTPVAPFRPYNQRNGFSIPFKVQPKNIADVIQHPRWLLDVVFRRWLKQGAMVAENYPEALRTPINKAAVGKFNLPFCADLDWGDIREIRKLWDGPLLVKGIMHPDDAASAIEAGADGVVVSNHGGRNLDSTTASIKVLPQIADRVGQAAKVFFDSGVTRGADIAKAVALGADGVFVGKSFLFGVGAAGEAGALRVSEILKEELQRVMTFAGARNIADLNRDLLFQDIRTAAGPGHVELSGSL